MAFYTTLHYLHPRKPPSVTGNELSRFVTAICDTGTLTDSGLLTLSVKFGEAIDQDDHGTTWEEISVPGVATVHQIEWDIDLLNAGSIQDLIDGLADNQRCIYRAHVTLGMPINEVLQPITRVGSPENKIDYCPDTLSIQVGPIECYNAASEEPVHAGWIAVGLSGSGYLYPWTFPDVVRRMENSPEICRIMETCRSFWSVPPGLPEPRIVELRKQFKDLWPYDDFEKPWDWYWGLLESG